MTDLNGTEGDECPVCLEKTENADGRNKIAFSHCPHFLCGQCYPQHIRVSNQCPVCRSPIEDQAHVIDNSLTRIQSLLTDVIDEFRRISTTDAYNRISDVMNRWSHRQNITPAERALFQSLDQIIRLTEVVSMKCVEIRGGGRDRPVPMPSEDGRNANYGQTTNFFRSVPMQSILATLASMHPFPSMLGVDLPSDFDAIVSVSSWSQAGTSRMPGNALATTSVVQRPGTNGFLYNLRDLLSRLTTQNV